MEPAPSDTLLKQIGGGESQVSYGSGERPRYSALARQIDAFYADLQPPLADLRETVFAATQLPEEPIQKQASGHTDPDACVVSVKHSPDLGGIAVSILTDPEGSVLGETPVSGLLHHREVSILTRPNSLGCNVTHDYGTIAAKAQGDSPWRYTAKIRRILDAAITKFLDTVAGPDRSRKGYVNGGAESDQSDGILQQRQIMAYSVGLRRASDLVGTAQTLAPSRSDPAVREMLDHAFLRLSDSGTLRLESVRDEIHGILVSGADAGLSPLDVGRQLSKQFDQYSGYEFERLARTESAFASEAGNREQMMEFGVSYVTWLLSSGACPICTAYEGKIIPIEEVESQPPGHPNCACSTQPYLGGLT